MNYRFYHRLSLTCPTATLDGLETFFKTKYYLGLERESQDAHWTCLRAYFADAGDPQEFLQELQGLFPLVQIKEGVRFGLPSAHHEEEKFEPFSLGNDFWIAPPGASAEGSLPGTHIIELHSGMAFGTGRHETTQLMLQLLGELKTHRGSLLDVGTGSGILAIAAHRLGFGPIDGVEIESEAKRLAEKNFRLNGMEKSNIYEKLSQIKASYSVVLANLLAPTLLSLKKELTGLTIPQGKLLISGFQEEEESELRGAFSEFHWNKTIRRESWLAAHLEKQGS